MKMKAISKWLAFVLVALVLVALMPMAAKPVAAANPNTTAWIPDQMVSDDIQYDDRRPSIATGKYNYLYVAYEHYNPESTKYEIKVAKSTDGGTSWSIIHTKSLADYNLYMPSIAADPYEDYLYVAYEREYSSSDRDIWLDRYVGGTWYTELVDNDGDNDWLPSITVEYDMGTSNYVYIAYEKRITMSSIDLMFAKSTNHGDTWTLSTLADYGWMVYQASMTYADGYIYVVYRHFDQIEQTHDIDLKVSSDRGSTWTTKSYISNQFPFNYPNSCSEPSVAATHGGGVVVAAWTYAYSGTDDDIRYSYSTDYGLNWSTSQPMATSTANERWPHLAVDGMGYTTNWADAIHVTYEKQETVGSRTNGVYHREAHLFNPTSWSSPVQVGDDDAKISWFYPTYVDRAITTRGEVPVVVFTDFGMGVEDGIRGDYDIYATTLGGKFTIDTRPSGLRVRVDGVDYWAPVSFWWAWGSGHALYAYSPQGPHTFLRWSDGLPQSHTHVASTTYEELILAYYTPTLTLSLSPTTVPRGASVTISGQLTPGLATTISLYWRMHGTFTWTLGTKMATNAAGAYSITPTIPMSAPTGTLDMIVAWYDSANNRYAVSEIKQLTITP